MGVLIAILSIFGAGILVIAAFIVSDRAAGSEDPDEPPANASDAEQVSR